MTVSDKTDVVVQTYKRTVSILDEGMRRYFQDELQRIENSLNTFVQAAVQVVDNHSQTPSEAW